MAKKRTTSRPLRAIRGEAILGQAGSFPFKSDDQLRLECLQEAIRGSSSPGPQVIQRAQTYFNFVKGIPPAEELERGQAGNTDRINE